MSLDFLREHVSGNRLVIQPDHPLLLRAPDALVGGSENICAIFEPHSLEMQNPAHLVARLVSSRLALPRYTRTVLVLKRSQDLRFAALENDFGLVTDRSDRSLPKFLGASQEFGKSRPMDTDSQAIAGKNFDLSMEIANFAYRLHRTSSVSARQRKSAVADLPLHRRFSMGPFHYTPKNRVAIDGVEASILSARSRSTLTRQVNAALTGNLLETYDLDQGVPYQKGKSVTQLAIASEIDEDLGVRSKLFYSAAFLGTALIATNNSEVVLEVASRYRDSIPNL